jgi:hypothetical protein
VIAIWQNYETAPQLADIYAKAMETVKDCHDLLNSFSTKIRQKYDISLGGKGDSSSWVKTATKKTLWLREKEDVAELRARLQTGSNAIMLFTLAAMR